MSDEDQIRNAKSRVTVLMDYFALKFHDEFAKEFAYTNILFYYVFMRSKTNERTDQRWKKLQREYEAIGQMYLWTYEI